MRYYEEHKAWFCKSAHCHHFIKLPLRRAAAWRAQFASGQMSSFTWSTLKAFQDLTVRPRGLLPTLWLTFRRKHCSFLISRALQDAGANTLCEALQQRENGWVCGSRFLLGYNPGVTQLVRHGVSHSSVSQVLSFLLCKTRKQELINFMQRSQWWLGFVEDTVLILSAQLRGWCGSRKQSQLIS